MLSKRAFGISLALVSAFCMLLLGIAGNIGIYMGAVDMMMQWHALFNLSVWGIITGIIEGAVFGFIFGWLIAYVYNRFE